MLRSLLISLVTLGALTVAPVAPLGALAPASAAGTAGETAEMHPEWGRIKGHDARLRKGCRSYVYDYAVTPPDGYWALETFLIGPDGERYGSGYFDVGADAMSGQGAFRLCARSVGPGRYTIRALVSVTDGQGETQSGWLADSTFRLRHKRR